MKIKWLYFLLLTGVVVSAAFFALILYKYYQRDSVIVSDEISYLSEQLQEDFRPNLASNIKSLSFYENLFKSKKIFKVLGKEETSFQQRGVELQISLEKEFSKFELLGIVSSGGRSQALIKDNTSGRTFYCSGGEKIDGFIVKEVLSDKVILERGEWAAELRI